MEDSLSSDLFEFLLDTEYEMPTGNQRRESVWLMHPAWYDDCKKLEKWEGPAYEFLFGHPIWVSEDYGVPELVTLELR